MKKKKKERKDYIFWALGILGTFGILVSIFLAYKDEVFQKLFPAEKRSPLGLKNKKEVFNFTWGVWEDPAGFSFEYPKEVEIDVHSEDETNYAFLELKSKEREGSITIICTDSLYQDINEWFQKDSLVKQGNALETQIASVSAQKVSLGEGREVTAFIDWDQVLYQVDKQSDKELDYWNQIYDRILNSFKLIPLEGESEAQFNEWLEDFNTAGADVVEPVEIIE
ncbi:hypothetical protein COT75_04675 [Candidatus Beckwithbacteria bacterium CG10_big_fil_rev_8_21_14_0_10_34_10]|uniref:Uncharacterized protein n=1 Tax=Candidatus Beckwithbacteria bacterium CG10_big_fil_rev_8_21_14_0_10_34_10 TaxID=1974495 RepID=A0A2H0W9Z6_9BACT|nr:MAG: hypothetical protein COT75_04675 [Candidatus Beckwithbacteria bacterium CG10_big_fil_rev_8_21_14_0_10_34_10]